MDDIDCLCLARINHEQRVIFLVYQGNMVFADGRSRNNLCWYRLDSESYVRCSPG